MMKEPVLPRSKYEFVMDERNQGWQDCKHPLLLNYQVNYVLGAVRNKKRKQVIAIPDDDSLNVAFDKVHLKFVANKDGKSYNIKVHKAIMWEYLNSDLAPATDKVIYYREHFKLIDREERGKHIQVNHLNGKTNHNELMNLDVQGGNFHNKMDKLRRNSEKSN